MWTTHTSLPPAPMELLGNTMVGSEPEGGREPRNDSEAQDRDGDYESEEDGRLGVRGESAEAACSHHNGLGCEPSEEASDGDEEEDAEGRERERGRLELDARQDRGRHEGRGDRRSDREGERFDGERSRSRESDEGQERRRHPEADDREAEHQASEISAWGLRRAKHDPEILALVEGPVHRQDTDQER